ncbi:beta-ketoacyl synthase chain length factor [Dyella sp. A6]|uniref:beta-ketoacyl synthase chain length factor n=1 Tax=Dyella aluminiiresistens TaxID=3069105 RepID=UPI002E797AD3|nr:beta-ketoacyl synthase chain length factor [Dyella sp. A6]
MSALVVHVEGIGLWSPGWSDFQALCAQPAGSTACADATGRPPALTLPATERRRASSSVLLAVEVAAQAVAMSGRDPTTLACVFASAHGDLLTTDYLCATLARAPDELSPTRFHHSVHNAPAGYWTIASGCHAPSSAVCAGPATAGAGLLEAATLTCAEQCPVLLVCSDIRGHGPLGEIAGCRHDFGWALVLSPQAGPRSRARLMLGLLDAASTSPSPINACTGDTPDNPSAAALPLLTALVDGHGELILPAATALGLHIRMERPL